jgi:pyridoxal phosphate enzyme (YggS family)
MDRWKLLQGQIQALQPAAVLIAVSKAKPVAAIKTLLEAGQRDFAENRVQEALEKWPQLKAAYPDVRLHLIGSLQSNKAKEALELFDAIHTVDRESLVNALVKESSRLQAAGCRQFFIQVNTGEEAQKGGVTPDGLPRLMQYIQNVAGGVQPTALPIAGLMCIPPADELPAPHFALLRTMAQKLKLDALSMGMSGDYETALRLGATHVRIGTAIFGERL